jgi:hypothetical protein
MLLLLLLLTTILLVMVALVFGFSRRPWWQIGILAVFACGPLQFAHFWMDDWRHRVGLSAHEQSMDLQVLFQIIGWLLLCSYVGYALGFLARTRRLNS